MKLHIFVRRTGCRAKLQRLWRPSVLGGPLSRSHGGHAFARRSRTAATQWSGCMSHILGTFGIAPCSGNRYRPRAARMSSPSPARSIAGPPSPIRGAQCSTCRVSHDQRRPPTGGPRSCLRVRATAGRWTREPLPKNSSGSPCRDKCRPVR